MTHMPIPMRASAALAMQEGGAEFQQFLQQAAQAPILSAEEEYELATRFQQQNDLEAAHRLVHSYLRLVIKTAKEYLGYRLSLPDLVQEGTVGLMHAVKTFDPNRGNRLATYAIWWIRAAIHDLVLRSWRMVKIATTRIKRQLFFKLRQTKSSAAPLRREEAEELASKFGTDVDTILEVDTRMSGYDESLNQPAVGDDDGSEWIEQIPDQRPNQELRLLSGEQRQRTHKLLHRGLSTLNPREQQILTARYLAEEPQTLESLAQTFAISRERVRQVEKRALEKLKEFLQKIPDAQEWVPVC